MADILNFFKTLLRPCQADSEQYKRQDPEGKGEIMQPLPQGCAGMGKQGNG